MLEYSFIQSIVLLAAAIVVLMQVETSNFSSHTLQHLFIYLKFLLAAAIALMLQVENIEFKLVHDSLRDSEVANAGEY
jgi:hypothetical protein